MRQPFLSRLIKPKSTCVCTETVCQPAAPPPPPSPPAAPAKPAAPPLVVKAPPTPATPPTARDARESWGEVKPWTAPTTNTVSKPAETVTKRVDPVPVVLEKSAQPSPLENPGLYREMAKTTRLRHSKVMVESKPVAPRPQASEMAAPPGAPSPTPGPRPGRAIELPANEANAFWTPPKPPAPAPDPAKFNAFDRDPNAPPQPDRPALAGLPPGGPVPPRGPVPMLPQPSMMPPMGPDVGIPDAMGNAFTLAGTRRPIPADFGGTPQEPNGFDPPVQMGQGSPPQGYSMGMPNMPRMPGMPNMPGMPGMPRPPMPYAMAMGSRMPMGVNPLMRVPPTQAVAPAVAERPSSVPQLLMTLKDSLMPSERETAAERLSEQNWRTQPQVVQYLMKSAKDDPAATVRAACVHALTQMKPESRDVVALMQQLKSDRDPRVRHEAEEASVAFGNLQTPGDSAIQRTSHR
jgi:hypothetical protein